ncbi:hypothetical protein [Vibrio cincinnatiensis]|uniref:hypothetical protein n=1 Tax=Vibrio cincinnatiensis TaxID=675 RepID=UPI001EE08C48|nr:hypothetical protein [Vibrio cincinnatiensis]
MQLNLIVSRVYLGFFILIFIMLFSAVVLLKGNEEINANLEFMTQESTPLMLGSGELTISFLNINRSLNSYLSAMYVDELDSLREAVHANIQLYEKKLDWFEIIASKDADVSLRFHRIKETSIESFRNITQVLESYSRYLELREQNIDQQSLFQSLAIQLNSNLLGNLAKTTGHQSEKWWKFFSHRWGCCLARPMKLFHCKMLWRLGE